MVRSQRLPKRPVRTLRTISAGEALEHDLERRILESDFAPGDRLREVELSEEYGVGRHTLRAAFDRLSRRGFLTKERNRGVSVRELTIDDLREIFGLRETLEIGAVQILAKRRLVPETARLADREFAALAADSPPAEIIEADLAFHHSLVAASDNRRLQRVHCELGGEIRLCLAQLVHDYAPPAEVTVEHARIIEMIEAGRASAAADAVTNHLSQALEWLIRRA